MHFGFALICQIQIYEIQIYQIQIQICQIKIFPVNILFVSKTSSRRLQDISSRPLQDMSLRRLPDMSSTRLQHVFSVTIFRLPRRLQDVFKTSRKKTKNCYAEDVLKTCLEDVFKTPGKQTKCSLGISASNKSTLFVDSNLQSTKSQEQAKNNPRLTCSKN